MPLGVWLCTRELTSLNRSELTLCGTKAVVLPRIAPRASPGGEGREVLEWLGPDASLGTGRHTDGPCLGSTTHQLLRVPKAEGCITTADNRRRGGYPPDPHPLPPGWSRSQSGKK